MENTCKLVSVKSEGRPSVKISHIVPTSFLAMWECVRVVYTNPRVYAAIKPSLESLTQGHVGASALRAVGCECERGVKSV